MTDDAKLADIVPAADWAIVEIFGHRSHAGLIQEVERFGTKMLRIDVPGTGDEIIATHFYGGGSIFSLRPCTEAAARKAAEWERQTVSSTRLLSAPDIEDPEAELPPDPCPICGGYSGPCDRDDCPDLPF